MENGANLLGRSISVRDEEGRLHQIPRQWTELATEDPVVVLGGGRSFFRVGDLLRLSELIQELNKSTSVQRADADTHR